MASGVQLVLGFETRTGSNMVLTFDHANPSATTAQVKALMNGIIANGSIFANVPTKIKSAKQITMSESNYDLSD